MASNELTPRADYQQPLVALTEQQRLENPSIIYEQDTSGTGQFPLMCAAYAAQSVGLRVEVDLSYNPQTRSERAVVRTDTTDHNDCRTLAALFQGAVGVATNAYFEAFEDTKTPITAAALTQTKVEGALRQITDDPDMLTAFKDYYGGMRIGSDKKRFVEALFEGTAAYVPEENAGLSGYTLYSMAYALRPSDAPDLFKLRDKTPDAVIAHAPWVDYRQLEDPQFAASAEGKALQAAYAKSQGAQKAQLYSRFPRPIDSQGNVIPKPIVPLAEVPIVEALFVDALASDKPQSRYSFSADGVNEIALDSDSTRAQDALVRQVTTPLNREDREPYDGPNELEHKSRAIREILKAYQDEADTERRTFLRDKIIEIIDAYTGDGAMATMAQQEAAALKARDATWTCEQATGVRKVKELILGYALVAPDASMFLNHFAELGPRLPVSHGAAPEADELALQQSDLVTIIFDALTDMRPDSQIHDFASFAHMVFGSEALAAQIAVAGRHFANSHALRRKPEVMLAIERQRKTSYDTTPTAESEQAKRDYDLAREPADHEHSQGVAVKNQIIFDLLETSIQMAPQHIGANTKNPVSHLFGELVKRISFYDSATWGRRTQLPDSYSALRDLALRPEVSDSLKADIVWHTSQTLLTHNSGMTPAMMQLMLDCYQIMLGEPSEPRFPTYTTSHGLAAADHILHELPNIFRAATEEQLQAFVSYKEAITTMLETAAQGDLPPEIIALIEADERRPYARETSSAEEAIRNVQDVARHLETLEKAYRKHLHIEQVKAYPHVFYPWMLTQLQPFAQAMNWEVSPGNRPDQSVRKLHNTLNHFITQRFKWRPDGYPTDFDVVGTGALGAFLEQCYDQMVTVHDMGYVGAVWNQGLPFLGNIRRHMPTGLVTQLEAYFASKGRHDIAQYVTTGQQGRPEIEG